MGRRKLAAGLFLSGAALAPQAWAQQGQNFIGLAAALRPRYEGADEYRVRAVPLINYEYKNFFISPRGGLPSLGLKWSPAQDLTVGVLAGIDLGRDESDADILHGTGDIDAHALYGGFAEWSPGRFRLGAAYRQAARSGYGGSLELRASYDLLRAGAGRVSVGASTEWASSGYMQTWFGVSAAQAARSGGRLQRYEAGSGIKSAALFAAWSHRLGGSWSVISSVGVKTLLGDARDSPIVERRTAVFGVLGLTYAF